MPTSAYDRKLPVWCSKDIFSAQGHFFLAFGNLQFGDIFSELTSQLIRASL